MNAPLTFHETIDAQRAASPADARETVRQNRDGELFVMSNGRAFGGAEQSLRTILPHIADAIPVRIFVENEAHYQDLARLAHPNVTLVKLPLGSSPLAIVAGAVRLIWHFLRERPRVLLANSHKGALLLALLRPWVVWSRARFAIYVRDFDHYYFPLILPLLGKARYFAPTSAVFEHPSYVRWGLTKRRCEVIPNAVKLPDAPAEGTGDYIGCCARLVPWKGVEFLIQAFAKIAREFPDARVRIHGEVYDEGYVAGLKRLVAELNIDSQVEFKPFEFDAEKLFGRGMFFVIPSVSTPPGPETFGRIVIEAWSWRKPVISFDVGGPRLLIENGQDGFLVEERNVDELAARMAELLRDPERRREMGERGYTKVLTGYQPKAIAARVLEGLFS